MAHEWIKVVGELCARQIAHGDHQHGKIMVVGNRLVLVDYDEVFVPTMDTGFEKDRVARENGLPPYKHPGCAGRPLSPDLDHFSVWVILISLKAVADEPSLWSRMIGSRGEESLLITEKDIKEPDRWTLWPELIDGPFDAISPIDTDIFGPLREIIRAGDW